MLVLPVLASVGASLGWASGIVLAQSPASRLGAFEFTRIQLIACAALMALICTGFGYWPSIQWAYWPAFAASITVGIVMGNLAMIACLRRAGPRVTELLLSLKAPLVGAMAYLWLGEQPSTWDVLGGVITLCGIALAVLFNHAPDGQDTADKPALLPILALGVGATACQGFGFLVMKPAMLAGTEPLAASAIRLLGAAFLISLVALWPAQIFRSHSALTPVLLGRTVLPGFIGYGISSSLLLYAFANFDAGVAAVLGSLSPVLVLPILYLTEGSIPRAPALAGAALAVCGTAVIALL